MKKITVKVPTGMDLFLKSLVETLNAPAGQLAILNQTAVTPSAGYSQSEAQAVANNLKEVADKLDTLIGLLKQSNILTP